MSHDHFRAHDTRNPMSFEEKLIHLLDHWIRHNEEHVKNYREWAVQAREHHLAEAAGRIEEAAVMTETVTGIFGEALSSLSRLEESS